MVEYLATAEFIVNNNNTISLSHYFPSLSTTSFYFLLPPLPPASPFSSAFSLPLLPLDFRLSISLLLPYLPLSYYLPPPLHPTLPLTSPFSLPPPPSSSPCYTHCVMEMVNVLLSLFVFLLQVPHFRSFCADDVAILCTASTQLLHLMLQPAHADGHSNMEKGGAHSIWRVVRPQCMNKSEVTVMWRRERP